MSWPSISALTAGHLAQRLDAGLHEEAHEAELHVVALLEQLLVLVAQLHDGAHVHVVERGEHGGGVLRVLEAPGDGLAQARHAHALLARRVVGDRRRRASASRAPARWPSASGRRLRARLCAADGLAAAAATSSLRTWPRRPEPCTSAGGKPLLLHHLARSRCRRHAAVACRRGAGAPAAGAGCGGRRLRWLGLRGGACAGQQVAPLRPRTFLDGAQHGADADRRALLRP